MTALIEGASRQSYSATLPFDRFHCLLDEMPLHLIPQCARASLRLNDDGRDLILNPDCTFCPAGRLPEEVEPLTELLAGFALQGTMAWVRDRRSGNLLPFWLGPRLEAALHDLRTGEAKAANLPADVCALLAGAGILTSAKCPDPRTWEEVEKAGRVFREKGYAPLRNLIHPFHIAALRRYYRYLIRIGKIELGDGQSPRRYVTYNEPVARYFHHQLNADLSAVAGEPLKPSYVYTASYLSGAELKKHTDRAQCEFSITLCLDFSPEPALETPWPIRLDTPSGAVEVHQALGDGLAYRGTKLPHYRDVLPEGQTSTSIFFHYVGADFEGPLD